MYGKNRYVQHFLTYLATDMYIYLFVHLFSHFIYLFCENKKKINRRNAFSKSSSKRMGARGDAFG
jgi:hypothetical protein